MPAGRAGRESVACWVVANLEELAAALLLNAQEAKMLEQLKGHGITVVEPDQAAFREAMKPVYEKYDSIWTKELREKIQAYR